MLWFYILQGVVYGFSAAVQPGPFQTYLVSQALSKGWKRTLPAALAPLVSDGPIIAICLLVLSQVPIWFQRFLFMAGGVFVFFFSYWRLPSLEKFRSSYSPCRTRGSKKFFESCICQHT